MEIRLSHIFFIMVDSKYGQVVLSHLTFAEGLNIPKLTGTGRWSRSPINHLPSRLNTALNTL